MAGEADEPHLPMELPAQQAPVGFHVDADEVPCRFCPALVAPDAWAGLCDECADSAEWED